MSENIPTYANEAAFPQPHLPRLTQAQRDEVLLPAQWGLTRRELFAAMTLQGLLSNEAFEAGRPDDAVVEKAVQYADKLLKELAK